eukprot:CAMPEP_0118804306 /NCGR_PEP_ID=MMETSP1161-20130426/22167_1 /TAXON_ID=249345 /ORGANISM="Picochlorum oklahomensis, Strain CCMP2329" /LENGTH=75 /DNA_ID=CAMNT_0006733031 /DNA_START=86 /DNA_END=313 /DNA_ORIENTATION=+
MAFRPEDETTFVLDFLGMTEAAASGQSVGPCLAMTAEADLDATCPMETISPPERSPKSIPAAHASPAPQVSTGGD